MKKIVLFVSLFFCITASFAQWITQNTGFATASRGINYMHCVDANIVWAAAYDGSGTGAYITEFTKTTNGGTTWVPGNILNMSGYGIGNLCAIDGLTAWAAIYYGQPTQNNNCGIYKTIDGGGNWVHQSALQGSASFADNVYFWNGNVGMCHGDVRDGYFEVYTTNDGGTTWTRVPQANFSGVPVASGEGGWTSVIDVTGSTVAFGTNKGNIYMSNDYGVTWVASATGAPTTGTNGGINEIALKDPMNGLVAHVNETTYKYELFRTTDGGATWTPVTYTGNAYSNAIAYVPGSWNTYITTGAATALSGCSYSFDGGDTWTTFNATDSIQFLATSWVDNANGWAGAFNTDATTGGMWKYNDVLAEILSIDPRNGGFTIYPNPGNGLFTVATVGMENQQVDIRVYDMLGKLVYQDSDNQSLVSYNKVIDLQQLPKGMYIAEIMSGKTSLKERIVIE